MDSSSAQQHHHQEMGLESMVSCKDNKKARPADMQALKCPRCESSNTKFCYYNNYSLSQPRYFCKSCRRYWTKGGTLRNVPVGGGCRKNKRSSSSSSTSSTSSSAKRTQSPMPPLTTYNSNDLNLAIARLHNHNSHHLGLDFSIWGSQQPDLLGAASSSGLFRDTGMHNMYYGEVDGMGISGAHDNMGMPSSYNDYGGGSGVGVKHEMCGARRDGEGDGRILWGFPWQNMNSTGDANGSGSGSGSGSDFDSARLNWTGIGSSNWQGLLNSPLT